MPSKLPSHGALQGALAFRESVVTGRVVHLPVALRCVAVIMRILEELTGWGWIDCSLSGSRNFRTQGQGEELKPDSLCQCVPRRRQQPLKSSPKP